MLHYIVHGGSTVYLLRVRGFDKPRKASEMSTPLGEQDWRDFSIRSSETIKRMSDLVVSIAKDGYKVAGYGAPAKATVVVNACGWSSSDIPWITDTTPSKVGRLVPGTDIPVVEDAKLLEEQPSFAIMFPWNYGPEILKKKAEYIERGGSFIVMVPAVRVESGSKQQCFR